MHRSPCRPSRQVRSSEQAHCSAHESRALDSVLSRVLARIQASGQMGDVPGEVLDGLPEPGDDLDQWQRQATEALAEHGTPALFQAALRLLRRAREALPASPTTARPRLAGARRLMAQLTPDVPETLREDLAVEAALTQAWCELAEGRESVAAALTAWAEEQLPRTSGDPLLEGLVALTRGYVAAGTGNWTDGYRELVRAVAVLQAAEEPFEAIEAEPALARHLQGEQAGTYPTDERAKAAVRRLLARCEPRGPESS